MGARRPRRGRLDHHGVEGKRALHGGTYRIIADRIVGATYLCAAACCGGEVRLRGVDTAAAFDCVRRAERGGLHGQKRWSTMFSSK